MRQGQLGRVNDHPGTSIVRGVVGGGVVTKDLLYKKLERVLINSAI